MESATVMNLLWKTNLHTHTHFSDGKNSIEEMTKEAIKAGLTTLGFTDHSPIFIDSDCNMAIEKFPDYLAEIDRCSELYPQITLLKSLEIDYVQESPILPLEIRSQLDYSLASVHFLYNEGEQLMIDFSADYFEKTLFSRYDNEIKKLAKAAAQAQCELLQNYRPDILGHIDLFTKFNSQKPLFDEEDPDWKKPIFELLAYAKELGTIIEINTGAISRGYRKTPYPHKSFIRFCAEEEIPMTLNGDSHAIEGLITAYNSSVQLAKSCGIRQLWSIKKENSKRIFSPQNI